MAHIDFTAQKVGCASPLDLLNVRASDTRGQEEIPIVYGGALCVKDYALSSIGDRVWYDTNGNGVQNAGEPGLVGVKVNLTGTDEFAQPVNLSAITGADGKYLFDGLRAGMYKVEVDETTLPANHFLTTGNNPTWVTLARGENRLDVDFGYTMPALGGWVFIDVNGNGIRDAGETAGIAGVPIELRNAATNALLQTVVSGGSSGWFEFLGIVPGSYKVIQLTQPVGYVSTSPDTVMVTIVGGQHKAANFGEWIPPAATSTPTATATPCRDLPADQHDVRRPTRRIRRTHRCRPDADEHDRSRPRRTRRSRRRPRRRPPRRTRRSRTATPTATATATASSLPALPADHSAVAGRSMGVSRREVVVSWAAVQLTTDALEPRKGLARKCRPLLL